MEREGTYWTKSPGSKSRDVQCSILSGGDIHIALMSSVCRERSIGRLFATKALALSRALLIAFVLAEAFDLK
ncbi:Hypothetical protein FKW44_003251, partial [Caligus rogercresseyi]